MEKHGLLSKFHHAKLCGLHVVRRHGARHSQHTGGPIELRANPVNLDGKLQVNVKVIPARDTKRGESVH